jgi:hypothetical protein
VRLIPPATLGVERGHRTLVITRKGGKVVTIALAPRTEWIKSIDRRDLPRAATLGDAHPL